MPGYGAGGVAYINVFGHRRYADYSPALVYYNKFGNREDFVAEGEKAAAPHLSSHRGNALTLSPVIGVIPDLSFKYSHPRP